MTERVLTALRNSIDRKVYIIIKGDELQKEFLIDAEAEGFRFGTIKIILPLMLLHSSRTSSFPM